MVKYKDYGEPEKCLGCGRQHYGGETTSKAFIWETKEEMVDNLKLYLKGMCCDGGRRMELAYDGVQWRTLV
jgi:hypothetical protein